MPEPTPLESAEGWHPLRIIGHYGNHLWIGIMVVFFGLSFLPGDTQGLWVLGVFVAAVTAGLLAVIAEIAHDGHICLRCGSDLPANGSERAVRKQVSLWSHHYWPWVAVALAAVWIALPAARDVINLAIPLATIYISRVNLIHRKLTLWCPWCQRRGGEDDTDGTGADPDPDSGEQR